MKSGRTMQHSIVVALLFAMSWTFVAVRPASAATIVVDGVTCTLADAITAANTDTATGGCLVRYRSAPGWDRHLPV